MAVKRLLGNVSAKSNRNGLQRIMHSTSCLETSPADAGTNAKKRMAKRVQWLQLGFGAVFAQAPAPSAGSFMMFLSLA